MNIVIIALTFVITLGILGLAGAVIAFMVDSVVRGHDLPTSKRAFESIAKTIAEHSGAKNFYDLGCAHGALAIRIKKRFPSLSVHAVDNDPIRIFFAKIRATLLRREVHFLRKNIFELDLRDADIVYTYLWYDLMPPMEEKLQKELKRGAIVITNTSNFPNWKLAQKIVTYPGVATTPDFETLFVYRKGCYECLVSNFPQNF